MTPPLSTRARQMPASPIRKLMPLADDARRRGVHIYHLNIGQPDLETPAPMRERLARYRERVYAYTPSVGTPEFLQTLQRYYASLGFTLGLDELMATTGGSEAIQFALFACANEGDDALVVVAEPDGLDRADVHPVVVDLGLAGLEPLGRREDEGDRRPLAEDAGHRHPGPGERGDDRDDPNQGEPRARSSDRSRFGDARPGVMLRHGRPLSSWRHPR